MSPALRARASSSLEALLSRLPVDDVPDGLEILRLAVLILETVHVLASAPKSQTLMIDLLVRMLPSIHSQNRSELPNHRILIRIRPNLHAPRLRILDQPRPPTPLNACQCSVELLLERIQAAIAVVNRLAQRTCGGLAAALVRGRQVLPEQGVVEVAAAVEVDHGLQGDLGGDVGFGFCFGDLLGKVVVGGHVGVVVVFVVEFHDFAGDGGLEGAVVVFTLSLDAIHESS
jgi:hypothetical protein